MLGFLAAKLVVQKSDKNRFQFERGELLFRRPYVSWNVSNKIKNILCSV